jgi:hypothetical protein
VNREKLREQHALGEEIANAITSAPIGEVIDEDELNDELAELEQEQLDQRMTDTAVPVSKMPSLPAAHNSERELFPHPDLHRYYTDPWQSKGRQRQKRKMKKRSFESYKQRWPCERSTETRHTPRGSTLLSYLAHCGLASCWVVRSGVIRRCLSDFIARVPGVSGFVHVEYHIFVP